MKATYKALGGKLLVEIEFKDSKSLFEELAGIQEVCDIEPCGKCGNATEFRHQVRDVGDGKYHEIKCLKCFYVLGFGSQKKAPDKLYVRRKNNKTKQAIGINGWSKYDPNNHGGDD